MLELLKQYCDNIEEVFEGREEETNALIDKYRLRVQNNANITVDEHRAWLANIDIMRDYYLQYVTDERAYECALNALADKIHKSQINNIIFPLGNNYGLVFSHLIPVLTDYKPPYDAEFLWEKVDGETIDRIDMHRPAPLNV